MKCNRCQNEVQDNSIICPVCGNILSNDIRNHTNNNSANLKDVKIQTNKTHKLRKFLITTVIILFIPVALVFIFLLDYTNGSVKETIQIVKHVVGIGSRDASAKKGLYDVEITIPPGMHGDDTLDNDSKGEGIKKITENADGSKTIIMTKKTHNQLMNIIKEGMDKSIQELLDKPDSEISFQKISYNDSVSTFEIHVNSSFNSLEKLYGLGFHNWGSLYQVYDGVPYETINVTINFIDIDTNEIIASVDSSEYED